jgi:hypothetical protein
MVTLPFFSNGIYCYIQYLRLKQGKNKLDGVSNRSFPCNALAVVRVSCRYFLVRCLCGALRVRSPVVM